MDVKKQEKNIAVLLFLSDYKAGSEQEDYYEDVDKKPVSSGAQTNDAPVKYLLEMALKDDKLKSGRKLSILCITSNQVMNDKVKEVENSETKEFTMWERFQNYFAKYIIEDLGCEKDSVEFIPIPYDYNGESNAKLAETTNQMAQRIFGEISDRLEENNISDVYVDYTGGMRDIAFLMTTIIRYLEFSGINCQKVVYSQYVRDKTVKNRIYDITYIYEMFQMINGVNEFVTTGNVTALSEVFKSDNQTDKPVKDLLNSIGDFANAMSICDVSNIDRKLDDVNASISTVLESPSNNVKTAMLKELLPLMKEKMYLDDLGKKDYYIKLIRWCVENNMLQQALTLIEVKMPELYIDKKKALVWDKENKRKIDINKKVLLYKFYDSNYYKTKYLRKTGPYYEKDEKRIIFYYTTRDYNTSWGDNTDTDFQNTVNSELSGTIDLEALARECDVKLEDEQFIKTYCKFRRLEEIDSRENNEYYKSDYGSILKWCKGTNTKNTYEVQDRNGNTKASVGLQIELNNRMGNSQDRIDYLENTLLLHSALKKERNCCNHASEKGVRLPADVVKHAIEIYAQRAEKVLGFIGS